MCVVRKVGISWRIQIPDKTIAFNFVQISLESMNSSLHNPHPHPCHQLQVNSKGRQGSLALGGELSRRNKISLMRDKLSCTRYTTAAETAGNASMTLMGQGNRDAILRLLFYSFVFLLCIVY